MSKLVSLYITYINWFEEEEKLAVNLTEIASGLWLVNGMVMSQTYVAIKGGGSFNLVTDKGENIVLDIKNAELVLDKYVVQQDKDPLFFGESKETLERRRKREKEQEKLGPIPDLIPFYEVPSLDHKWKFQFITTKESDGAIVYLKFI